MQSIIYNSCAKINIGLNIVRKRDDGYHDLETVFYPVNLCDTISFKISDSFRFTCNLKELQNLDNNLIIKAKNKLEEITGKEIKTEIRLSKFIPLGGGLGGGSSNAAVTLKGLNTLLGLNLTDSILMEAALQLGSDVPFFLRLVPCLAVSRGEIMEDINLKIDKPILIVNPGVHVSTAWAFQNITPHYPQKTLKSILSMNPSLTDYKDLIFNDFEELVFSTFPVVADLKKQLYESGAMFALMSGSGSTVFGIYNDISDATKAQNSINNKYLSFIHYENT